MKRRDFLDRSGRIVLGAAFGPVLFSRGVWASALPGAKAGKKVLVLVIQRGAMDGLSMIPPIGESFYYESRPRIALPRQGDGKPIALGGGFGMHPSMAALKPMWDDGTLGFVHQCGSPDHSRSHFDAQDFLETGTPGEKNTQDGFLNRALSLNPLGASTAKALRAVALQTSMPRVLQGAYPAVSMASLSDYRIRTGSGLDSEEEKETRGFESMYQSAADQVFRGAGAEAFGTLHMMDRIRENKISDELYPKKNAFARRMGEIARLIRADIGLQVAVTDVGGWDTHINQGSEKGQLSERLRELAEGLSAFSRDLGAKMADVCVVCVTEFGRTVRENGTRGTDHGHGSVLTLLGGNVAGRRIHGAWTELRPANLFEGRDLPVTTDVRDVLGEVLSRHLGMKGLDGVFPKYAAQDPASLRWRGVLRA